MGVLIVVVVVLLVFVAAVVFGSSPAVFVLLSKFLIIDQHLEKKGRKR